VKNIPYGTTTEQIQALFEPFGKLGRVLVPPAGTIAVVEFEYPDEASAAFKGVAYRRLGSSIIYLEKAPIGVFKEDRGSNSKSATVSFNPSTQPIGVTPEESQDTEELLPGCTLFVKNLSFATSTEKLSQVFKHLPSFAYARVQTKPNPTSATAPRLSMGYGFVGFKTPDAAKNVLSGMNGFILDGHTLSVKFAGRGAEDDEKDEKGKGKASSSKSTKMIIKNVPFEATKKDIRDLFSAYGQLKSVRLPKRFDARSRGFAFIDFLSRHEAENAYAALRHTHLLGRHLVLEWAETGSQDVELLRQKAGVGLGDGGELPGKKRKVDLREDDDDGDQND